MSQKSIIINIFLVITLAASACLLWVLSTGANARLPDNTVFAAVHMEGEYAVDSGEWQPLNDNTQFDTDGLHTVYIRGNFTSDIPENLLLMLRITDLKVRMSINGEEVYSFGQDGQRHKMMRSGGNVWHTFQSPGITERDVVEVELSNIYQNVHPFSFRLFLDELHFGSVQNLYRQMFRENGGVFLLGLLIMMLGIVEFVVAVEFTLLKRGIRRTYYSAGLAFSCGIWFCIQFDLISLLFPFPALYGALDMICLYMIGVFLDLYIVTYLTEKRRAVGNAAVGVNILWVLCAILLQFAGVVDLYDTPSVGTVVLILCMVVSLGALLAECIRKPSSVLKRVLWSLTPIALGGFLEISFYWLKIGNDTIWVRVGYGVFILIQSAMLVYEFKETNEQANRVKEMEYDVLQNNVAIMLSQIQPHFLYNALNTIQNLCRKDPVQAAHVVQRFSEYLRGNLNSLKRRDLVPFGIELSHLQCYLEIEKWRFGDRVHIEYDFKITDFFLPVLTVQPMVENAVRYGVTKKKDGGTVRISSYIKKDAVIVVVADDGMGFDPFTTQADGRTHVGITNVKHRLESMCGGTLEIESRMGNGTTAVLTIPQKSMGKDLGGE